MPTPSEVLLRRHLLEAPGLYKVALGGGEPSSIRDQIRKATELVAAACDEGELRPGNYLLVVGAGVAGVAAAWKAVERGANAILYDLKAAPFSVQAGCGSRYLHPNEYQWPKAGYDQKQYPLPREQNTSPPLLKWQADKPSAVVEKWWRPSFRQWTERHRLVLPPQGSVRWEPEIERLFNPADLRRHVRRSLDEGRCQMAVLCVGATETCHVKGSGHRSYRFWEDDPYGTHRYGAPALPEGKLRTLVSGDGDGALQDFLRIACQKEGVAQPVRVLQILHSLLPVLRECSAYHPMMDHLADVYQERANRPPAMSLWDVHEVFLFSLATDPQTEKLAGLLEQMIDPALLRGEKSLHLNLKDGHFRESFTLNAFLVRLFIWHIERRTGNSVVRPGAMMVKIQSREPAHQCQSMPGLEGCLLKAHLVSFQDVGGQKGQDLEEMYHVIVIRHGITTRAL